MNEQKAEQAIKSAWVFGLISGTLTLIITLASMSGIINFGFDIFSLFDVLAVWGLTFGVYKKSRVCAILLFTFFVISKIIMMIETGKPGGVASIIIFGTVFFQGIRGTFYYHKNKNVNVDCVEHSKDIIG